MSVAGEPKFAEGDGVRVAGLTAQAWEMDGRSGMSFRAASITQLERAGAKAA
jgi:hypothetical protein